MISITHNFKVPAVVRGVLRTIEGAAKMERRVVDEIDVDVRRLVIFAVCASTVNQVERERESVGAPAISLFTRRSRASDMIECRKELEKWAVKVEVEGY